MLLAIDIGNTNVVMGVYKDEQLIATWRAETDRAKMPDEWAAVVAMFCSLHKLTLEDIDAAAISSTVPPLTANLREMVVRYMHVIPVVVAPGVKTGVRVLYDNPREVGADRIVNALAGYKRYGGPAIFIDFGTATTFDVINGAGDYLGGAISPGIQISTDALFRNAARLYSVELVRPAAAIGRNTMTSMQSGIIFGYIGLVEGLVERIKRELIEAGETGHVHVVATGGLAAVLAKETSIIEKVDENLTLDGLRLIWYLNHPG